MTEIIGDFTITIRNGIFEFLSISVELEKFYEIVKQNSIF